MKVEVFGVDKNIFKCSGCMIAEDILKEADIPYDFFSVIQNLSDEGIPTYDRKMIQQLAERAGFNSLSISYPVIFVDDKRILLKNLRQYLSDLGYDVDVF